MGEGMVLEFRRPRGPGRAPLIMAAFAVLFGVGQLIDGQSVWLYAPYLVLAVIIVAMAIPFRQPYACVSEESLTLASLLRFTQLRKVVPWSTVSAAWRKEAGLVVLSLTDGKRVTIHLRCVAREQQLAFLESLWEKLGPLPIADPDAQGHPLDTRSDRQT